MKLITHPQARAEALQEARRLRFRAAMVRKSDGKMMQLRVAAVFAELSLSESLNLWIAEREDFASLFDRAAALLEEGVGGDPQFDGPTIGAALKDVE